MSASDQRSQRAPPAEVAINNDLIRRLVDAQAPAYASHSIRIVGEGWDNVVARLGNDLAVRLPRRNSAVDLLLAEQVWLPRLAPTLPLPIPVPIFCGRGSEVFRFPWSIVPWLTGATADIDPPRSDQVEVYCAFLGALHVPAPKVAPHNPFRACSLQSLFPRVRERIDVLQLMPKSLVHKINFAEIERIWLAGMQAKVDSDASWIMGDVHAQNVICQKGKLVAFIDWGDLTAC